MKSNAETPNYSGLEHDAEKWTPVFGKTSCENKKLARRFEFIKTQHALVELPGSADNALGRGLISGQKPAPDGVIKGLWQFAKKEKSNG